MSQPDNRIFRPYYSLIRVIGVIVPRRLRNVSTILRHLPIEFSVVPGHLEARFEEQVL